MRRTPVMAVIAVLAFLYSVPPGDAASKPRVEEVAVEAADQLGNDAPVAVLDELSHGMSLQEIVDEISAGNFEPAPDTVALSALKVLWSASFVRHDDGTSILSRDLNRVVRTEAADAQREVSATPQPVSDPRTLARRAARANEPFGTPLVVSAILLAANNGYSQSQITDYIVSELIDPELLDSTGEGILATHGVFFAGGVIPGVDPAGEPVRGVFAKGPRVAKPSTEDDNADSKSDGELVTYAITVTTTSGSCIDGDLHGTLAGGIFSLNVGEQSGSGNTFDWPVKKNGTFDTTLGDRAAGEYFHVKGRVTADDITAAVDSQNDPELEVCTITLTGTRQG